MVVYLLHFIHGLFQHFFILGEQEKTSETSHKLGQPPGYVVALKKTDSNA